MSDKYNNYIKSLRNSECTSDFDDEEARYFEKEKVNALIISCLGNCKNSKVKKIYIRG